MTNIRLLKLDQNKGFSFAEYSSDAETPKYAILSHTWGEDNQEVTYNDIKTNAGKEKTGYQKLHFCGKQALRDGLEYFWVDTCCIDKSNSTELIAAINSMFRWYENAEKCYVFLSDVLFSQRDGAPTQEWLPQLKRSRWFTRGWTLQELLAPRSVEFFSTEGHLLGDKHSLAQDIHSVTGINILALKGDPLFQFSIDERMSWASERVTKEGEDAAYCLMGLFKVNMPLIYGEGRESALERLQEVIWSKIRHPRSQRSRRPKQRKTFENKETPSNLDTRKPFQTHRDPSRRHLIRFHEALVLLYTLGGTRSEQEGAAYHIEEDISSLPLKSLRRKFLTNVAYICDYGGDGRTATAIGLEVTPRESVFWVASSSSPDKMIISFMKSLLARISEMSGQNESIPPIAARDVFNMCIEFAEAHIEACRSALLASLERCLKQLDRTICDEGPDLLEWLRSWACHDSPTTLCYFAYKNFGSKLMRMLARLSLCTPDSTGDGAQCSFELCMYNIERLGRYYLAAATMLSYGQILPELRNDYRVEGIATPPEMSLPPFDISTTLDGIAVRKHPAKSPDLVRRQQALREENASTQLFQHFQENYISSQVKPHVHPEIQMLEWFYTGNRSFAANDPFIACSRPSCLCCQLYFRYHPGHFVEPISDRRICLSWRPHFLNAENNYPMSDHQQKILMNTMIKDIRKDALRLIDDRSMSKAKHPEIMTNTRANDDLRQDENISPQARSYDVPFRASLDLNSRFFENGGVSMTPASCCRKKLIDQILSGFDHFVDDSDEEGGILL